jgi:hypothetical protein
MMPTRSVNLAMSDQLVRRQCALGLVDIGPLFELPDKTGLLHWRAYTRIEKTGAVMTKRYTHSSLQRPNTWPIDSIIATKMWCRGWSPQAHLCRWAEVIIENLRPLVGLSLASVVLRTAQRVAAADRQIHPGELQALELIRLMTSPSAKGLPVRLRTGDTVGYESASAYYLHNLIGDV